MNYGQLLWDCWAYGSSYLPLCGLTNWAAAFLPSLGGGEIIPVGTRKFRVIQKLGEGGYAVVYLVSELATAEHPHPDPEPRALKRVFIHSAEQFDAVQQEMLVHSAVQHHPNILPLLDYCCSGALRTSSPSATTAATAAGDMMIRAMHLPTSSCSSSVQAVIRPPAPLPPPLAPAAATAPQPLQYPSAAAAAAAADGPGGSDSNTGAMIPVSTGGDGGAYGMVSDAGGGQGGGDDGGGGGGADQRRVACFLFPVFREGTLASELERLGVGAGGGGGGRGQQQRPGMLPTAEVLSLFGQLARAVAHIHAQGYAHRDIKPLNVLIATTTTTTTSSSGHRALKHLHREGGPGRLFPTPGLGVGVEAEDVEAGVALAGSGAGEASAADWGPRYRCVLMDFGSARPRRLVVSSRSEALRAQEDAEAHCSAPYRAPELFDVPSPATLDLAAADVWSLGASLFHIMYGEPPFHRAMNTAGGSLALAVINCAIGWPRGPAPAYLPELHQLVLTAMAPEPSARPSAAQLAEMAAALALRGLSDPAHQQPVGATGPNRP
ncbi:hypothetical protein VOLCADRAFT_118882 [Volvox carteri f. nagariensis]|uniref:non-specific serine/threonine protein kinase n=1 Tax=Volvox carteri f. nagariensis TaxID=3068 RepID=D8U8B9_VOLCA|nr:uncharacterized protein VOLCADRAFT_118882 [Volvox carteri f. nagariensis]EFJ44111.1 hypothetical protein VOLCADRAFT_118882 [Volvox carteri f. nagariensis]|eukprot:XP_002954912.1 hypothetical protein VOLCADRAFT_118882 [Volvox carteri f. nagariensis]